MKVGNESVAPGVAFAAEAVKGLRSQSLAPMNAARTKPRAAPLTAFLAAAGKLTRGATAPRLKTAPASILLKQILYYDWEAF